MSDRQQKNFKLTSDCRSLLAKLAERKGISEAAVVESAVRELAKKEKLSTT
jgi:hypothetical protein